MAEKASLKKCQEMLLSTSWQFKPDIWKAMFTAWLESNGWGYDEFRMAMQAEYKTLTGEDWPWPGEKNEQ